MTNLLSSIHENNKKKFPLQGRKHSLVQQYWKLSEQTKTLIFNIPRGVRGGVLGSYECVCAWPNMSFSACKSLLCTRLVLPETGKRSSITHGSYLASPDIKPKPLYVECKDNQSFQVHPVLLHDNRRDIVWECCNTMVIINYLCADRLTKLNTWFMNEHMKISSPLTHAELNQKKPCEPADY